ncbi:2-oxoglutarate-Fe(II) type oxidoreductase hxnY isoform X1 [Solanum stenotomum]|uniref:2-oxoglutarate-Fe(II) type oxidoreductase hxnY isoform X1 n=1 Tax=Solanum stenotomum TaxID=172797 RepID=UPI0020D0730D|nr:2-oxoglutarate-Fe(II) type oxidoreductase hxnY isoform X1 [Solanum stenotomum]
MMRESIQLPIIDLTSPDPISTARAIRQACVDVGFFYLINHGVDERLFKKVLEQNKKFFSLPLEDKMKLVRRNHRGYTPLYAEKLDTSSTSQGDSKESFYIGSLEGKSVVSNLNQWPAEEVLPSWRSTMEDYHRRVLDAGIRLISLIALALDLDEDFFHKAGACDSPNGFLRLLHYPGKLQLSEQVVYGASAHSDYGMLTLLATDGVGGLQARLMFAGRNSTDLRYGKMCITSVGRAFIVNIGDMMERWTNCLFRSTLHRVMPTGQERYSMAFFLDPNPDCVVECLKSCCSDSSPPRFPPIRAGEYLEERLKVTYVS